MKIPPSIKIGIHEIEIVIHEKISDADMGECSGLAHLDNLIIDLAKTSTRGEIPESKQAEIFLHEIIHFLSNQTGLNLKENQVNGLACQLLAVIRENDLDFT